MSNTTTTPRVKITSSSNIRTTNLSITVADTEQSHVLVGGVKALRVRNRDTALTRLSYVSGETTTNYVTIPMGCNYELANIDFSSLTLYVRASQVSTLEIEELY